MGRERERERERERDGGSIQKLDGINVQCKKHAMMRDEQRKMERDEEERERGGE